MEPTGNPENLEGQGGGEESVSDAMSSTDQSSQNQRSSGCNCLTLAVLMVVVGLGLCVGGEMVNSRRNKPLKEFTERLVGTTWSDHRAEGIVRLTFHKDGKIRGWVWLFAPGITKKDYVVYDYSVVWGSYEGKKQPVILVDMGDMKAKYVRRDNALVDVQNGYDGLRLESSSEGE